jgi:hypothetical protein
MLVEKVPESVYLKEYLFIPNGPKTLEAPKKINQQFSIPRPSKIHPNCDFWYENHLATLVRMSKVLEAVVTNKKAETNGFESDGGRWAEQKCLDNRVARFLLVQHTKTVKIYQMSTKCTKCPDNLPIGRKIYQMAKKYTDIFHDKTLKNLPQMGLLV